MKKIEYVLVYDSGIGGLTTLAHLNKACPSLNFLYFADYKNCPYGNKNEQELNHLIYNNIKNLLSKYNISYIVLACNTATTSSITYLRQNINIPIIGTEPNIKTPHRLGFKDIIVLSTPATAHTKKLQILESTITPMPHNIGIRNLALYIEEYKLYNSEEKRQVAKKLLDKTLRNIPQTTAIVLGCTHYIYLKDYIESKGYTCFDGNIGVANRLKSLVNTKNIDMIRGKINIITGTTIINLKYKKILCNYKNKI